MAIDRFENKNILTTTKVPVEHTEIYSMSDRVKLATSLAAIPQVELATATTEKHVYSGDNLIKSLESPLDYELSPDDVTESTYDILLNPETDIRLSGIKKGYYSIVYNFINTLTGLTDINRISADSTELELNALEYDNLGVLYNHIFANRNNETTTDLVLNFGNNELVPIIGIDFKNNSRVGEVVDEIPYPTDSFELIPIAMSQTGPTQSWLVPPGSLLTTTYYPIKDSDNFWIEVRDRIKFRDYLPTNPSQTFWPDGVPIPQTFGDWIDANLEFKMNINTTTGRIAKFNLKQQLDGSQQFEPETNTTGSVIYYTVDGAPGQQFDGPAAGYKFSKMSVPSAKVRYFNQNMLDINNPTIVVVKLYKPLKDELQSLRPSIATLVRDSYIERLLVYPFLEAEVTNNFSTPDFKIDMGNYGKSQGTDLKTWNTLLDTNLSTSQQIIDKYVTDSVDGAKLNIDYTYFGNFVNYSSAVERVKNFKYKLELIESFDTRIVTLESVSGSAALTNISQSLTRKSNVISGFDGFEKWMYYETSGSLYTHYSSSAYPIEPWPKSQQYPVINSTVNSAEAISRYNGLIDSASIFDAFNDARLTKMIPSSIAEDPSNNDYVLFIDMIGHHYDITWGYIKSLTSINEREEHPYDGMPNEMLYEVASGMGWKLTHSKDRSELWTFGVGTDKFGNYPQSGSLPSKSHEDYNYEIWRRIVNNIPYLLKSKGSARAVKALIATYGIPQTFLSIREYGGPMVDDVRPIWEHDKFVYHLRFDASNNYITVPWGNIDDIDPVTSLITDSNPIDVVELQLQQNGLARNTLALNKGNDFAVILEPTASTSVRGNIHFYLSGSGGYKSASITDVPIFDRTMSTLLVQRETSINDITQNNTYTLHYRRNRKGDISTSKQASIVIDGSTESSYNAAWTGSDTLYIGSGSVLPGVPTIWDTASPLSGSIQEIRYWANPLKDIVIDEHTLSRESYHGNSVTSSYFDLKFRYIPDSQIKTVGATAGIISQHPNQSISTLTDGTFLSASLFNFEPSDLRGVTEEYYTKVPSAGANNIMNNKVRLEPNRLTGILDPEFKKEKSKYDTAPVDTDQVGVYLSATKMYNEDIYNHTGYFEIDDYIGDPDMRSGFAERNDGLDYVRRQVFKKFSSRNLINTVIGTLAKYDFAVFEQIRQTMPARVDYNSGILIEPHILERPKQKSTSNLGYTNLQHDAIITSVAPTDSSVTGQFIQHEATVISPNYNQSAQYIVHSAHLNLNQTTIITATNDDIVDVGNAVVSDMHAPTQYKYVILNPSAGADVGLGNGWTTGSNGYWNYNAIGTSITTSTPSQYASSTVYFYGNALSASLNMSNSSSLVPSTTSTDNQPLSISNLKFLGCQMSSDSLTSNSPDTPDGGPVIEVFAADPNVLIYTSQTAAEGNLNVDVNTDIQTLEISELAVNSSIQWNTQQEYNLALSNFNASIAEIVAAEEIGNAQFDAIIGAQLIQYQTQLQQSIVFDNVNPSSKLGR
jgi:hypothetical protein